MDSLSNYPLQITHYKFLPPTPSTRDNVREIALSRPSQHPLSFRRGGHQHRRIARTPRSDLSPDRPSTGVFRCLDNFENGMSPACSQIDSQRVAVFFQVLQRPDVRIGEIVHVNVVANAGAIRSRVVGPVDEQLGSVRGGGGKRQWNQVSFRVVHLANLAAVVFTVLGYRSVEITQAHRA